MPLARQKAALASFPTLVELGNAVLRIRRTHANGGSNSIADVVLLLLLLLIDCGVLDASGDPIVVAAGDVMVAMCKSQVFLSVLYVHSSTRYYWSTEYNTM